MSVQLLQEIENWKLEAKLENSARYFYHTRVVDRILRGEKLYVIGRKGTGKTAISEHLQSLNEKEIFSDKLTFKNFPFNNLYRLKDEGFTAPNQHITLWKYVIYLTVCRMLVKDHSIESGVRKKLEDFFSEDVGKALSATVERWTDFKFDIKAFDYGFGVAAGRKLEGKNDDWVRRVSTIENFLDGVLGGNTYVVMFDELDEDYKDIVDLARLKEYTELLTGLFKAAQDVKARFSKFKIHPVIFLRDDIYDVLQDPDKTKWLDYKVDLGWDEDSIKSLLAFRISRAIDADGDILGFDEVWGRLISQGKVKYGENKSKLMDPFVYISRSSLLRPRDYIRYLQVCSTRALEREQEMISPAIVQDCDADFSNYLRSELADEIHGIVPEIQKIFDLFSVTRKQTIRVSEFNDVYLKAIEQGAIGMKPNQFNFVMEVLFHFSVIGNQPKQESFQVFKYKKRDARLNLLENIIVHRGLFRALQVL